MASPAYIERVLNEQSTDKYTIEWNEFFPNHMAHGIVALARLGATETRIDQFVQWYGDKLEHPTDSEKAEVIQADKMQDLLGKETSFYAIMKYYTDLLKNKYNSSVENLIAGELPKLSSGIIGAAFHGIIQLGYGYSAKNEQVILEGLAYSHYAYRPILPKTNLETWQNDLGKGEYDTLDALETISKDRTLIADMMEAEKRDTRDPATVPYFEKRVDFLLTEKADVLIDYAKLIQFPEYVYVNGKIDVTKLGRQVTEWALTMFTLSERMNDFILLHGVTSAWSLCQVLPLLKHDDAVKVLAEILVAFLATYLAQNCPKLTRNLGTNSEVTLEAWDNLVKEALMGDRDEHVYKLIHICKEMSVECGHEKPILLEAAAICWRNDFTFVEEHTQTI